MRSFNKVLNEKLKDPEFAEAFEEERMLLQISLQINERRKEMGLTQKELAKKASITQQQLSKIESGINCNIMTMLKVCYAMNLKIEVTSKI